MIIIITKKKKTRKRVIPMEATPVAKRTRFGMLKGQCVGIEAVQALVNITSSLNVISAHDNSASEINTIYPSGKSS